MPPSAITGTLCRSAARAHSRTAVTIGTPNNGGAVVTGGGVVFIAASTDNLIRAIDLRTEPGRQDQVMAAVEKALLALRNDEAREVLAEHSRRFRAELVDVISDVLVRLERRATIPLEQVTETAVALYMHSIAQEHLGESTLGPEELLDSVLPQVVLGLSEPLA